MKKPFLTLILIIISLSADPFDWNESSTIVTVDTIVINSTVHLIEVGTTEGAVRLHLK